LDTVTSGGGGTIFVTVPVVIDPTNGPEVFDGGSNVVLSGGSANSIFVVTNGGDLTLANMTLVDGVNTNGGAVYVFSGGTATFTDCLFSNNLALGFSGEFPVGSTNDNIGTNIMGSSGLRRGTAGLGGAIFNFGSVSVFNCQFVSNSAVGGVGGDGSDGSDGPIKGGNGGNGGAGGGALGGGIYTGGSLSIMDSTFSGNAAQAADGGVGGAGGSGLNPGVAGSGGAAGIAGGAGLYATNTNAVVVILSSTFAGNLAQGGTSQNAGTGTAGLGLGGSRGGNAFGGGIDNDKGGSTTLTNCTFFENIARGGAGGNGGDGGGAGGNGGNGGNATGGGIYNLGTVTAMNCTFSKGIAAGGTNGVAGSGGSSGKNGSRGLSRGGNIANANGKKNSFTLINSIIAAAISPFGASGFGRFADGGFNISADRSIVFKSAKKGGTSLANTNPKVGDLADNGGPTETVAIISASSPAVNFIQGDNFPPEDQRGVSRPQLNLPDAGAFELNPNQLRIVSQPQSANVSVGSNVMFSVGVVGPAPLGYQWYFASSNVVADDSDLLADATTNSVALTNVQLTDAGQFLVVVTNDSSAVTSHVATLTVFLPSNSLPVITNITIAPGSTVTVGSNAMITVIAGGTPQLGYQWIFQGSDFIPTTLTNGGNISGATSNVLTITNVQMTNMGNYTVVITNSLGMASTNVTLLVTTNTSGSTNGSPPPPVPLQSSRDARKASLHAAAARIPVAPDPDHSTIDLYSRRTLDPLRNELHKSPITRAVPPNCAAIDAARLWTFSRGAPPPHKTFPYYYRSVRAIV
jgi:hypothetical protein